MLRRSAWEKVCSEDMVAKWRWNTVVLLYGVLMGLRESAERVMLLAYIEGLFR